MTKTFTVAPISWPFWCLALAWLCANLPQFSRLDLRACLSTFQHFSHQSDLTDQTRALLRAEQVSRIPAVAKTAATSSPKPLVPAGDAIKKFELSIIPLRLELAPPFARTFGYALSSDAPPDRQRFAPPHRPPREIG